MIVLAIDTCFNACSVALARGDLITSERVLMRQGHAEALLPMIQRVVMGAGVAMGDIERIAVTHGPGTFTGVRTGLAAARGLALARGIPAFGFSSLRVIGIAAGGNVIVAADAGRSRLFVQAIGPDGAEITEPLILPVDDAAAFAIGQGLPMTGSGVQVLATAGYDIARAAGDPEPDAAMLIALAIDAPVSSGMPKPLYLREPDAKPQAGAAIARRQ